MKRKDKMEISLERMQQLAARLGGVCLSTEPLGDRDRLRWQCSQGHVWESLPRNIEGGHWCPRCGRAKMAEKKKKASLDELKEIVAAKGGRLLSPEADYVSTNRKLRFSCRCSHEWETRPSVIKSGHWCPVCMVRGRKKSAVSVLHELAAARGGRLLSSENMGFKVKHRWQCAKGHEWQALPWTVKRGSWCPKCAKRGRPPGSKNKKQRLRRGKGRLDTAPGITYNFGPFPKKERSCPTPGSFTKE